ncbi:MAG: hypothetical protein H0W68_14010 [Gemmatimonadaceae bacterium]|nr:hypothetical protein [Gemmatimonadaceae bacterium]
MSDRRRVRAPAPRWPCGTDCRRLAEDTFAFDRANYARDVGFTTSGRITALAYAVSVTLPEPGTVFFVGYGGSLSEDDPLAFSRLRRTGDAFFVKGSYVLRN